MQDFINIICKSTKIAVQVLCKPLHLFFMTVECDLLGLGTSSNVEPNNSVEISGNWSCQFPVMQKSSVSQQGMYLGCLDGSFLGLQPCRR